MKLSPKKLKFSRVSVLSMVVVGVVALGWLGLMLAGVFEPKKLGEKKVDPNRCPHCNKQLSPHAKATGECTSCHGAVGDKGKLAAREKFQRTVVTVLLAGFAVLFVVNVAVFVRSRVGKNTEEAFFYLHCRKCTRKVRYRERQIGQFARCPMCKTLMRFPEPPDRPRSRWAKMKEWLRRPKKNKPLEESA
jgi:uncharacterized paraquat-inducible protein A